MKDITKTFSLILFFIFIILLSGCIKKKIKIENTKYFSYSYTVGNYINGSVYYKIEIDENGNYIAYFKDDGVDEENQLKKEIDEDTIIELENILNKNNIDKWNGFDKVDKYVLDGNSFSLYYKNGNNEIIESSGYMVYPNGYTDFKNDIKIFFNTLFNNVLENE